MSVMIKLVGMNQYFKSGQVVKPVKIGRVKNCTFSQGMEFNELVSVFFKNIESQKQRAMYLLIVV